jgi:hypothetical protein
LRRNTSDFFVFKQQYIDTEYIKLVDLINKSGITTNTIIDAGAKVGFSALFFNLYFPGCNIIYIEPSIENAFVLSKNFKKTILNINFSIMDYGIIKLIYT